MTRARTRHVPRSLQVCALLAALVFLLQPAQGAILQQTPGLPGRQMAAMEELAEGLARATLYDFDDRTSKEILDAAARYEAEGGVFDPEMKAVLDGLADPMGRRIFSHIYRYAQQEPTVGQLQTVAQRQQDALLAEVANLEIAGIHASHSNSMGFLLGSLNFSSPEALNASWHGLAPMDRAFAVRLVADVGRDWAASSDGELAAHFGAIADEIDGMDPFALAEDTLETPVTDATVALIWEDYQDMLFRIVSDDVYRLDGTEDLPLDDEKIGDAIRREVEAMMQERALIQHAEAAAEEARLVETLAEATTGPASSGGVYFPGGSYNPSNDGRSGRDTSGDDRHRLDAPGTKEGLSYPGGLRPGDAEDGFYADAGGGAAIWSVYVTTPAGSPTLELNVSLTDSSGTPIPPADPTHDITEARMPTAPIPNAGGSADGTRATLHLPGTGGELRITVRTADGSAPTGLVPYLLTIERFEDNEALLSGLTRTEAPWPDSGTDWSAAAGTGKAEPALFIHGLVSSGSTWKQESDPWGLDQYLKGKYPRYAMLAVFLIYFLYMFKILYWDLLYIIVAPALFGIALSPWLFLIVILVLIMQLIDIAMSLDHWLHFFQGVARVHDGRETNGQSMLEYQRNEGYFVGTYEYHQKLGIAGTDLATPGSIKNAGENLRHGVNLMQQFYYNRNAKLDAGFSGPHPDDIKVALVGHSMGGMVARWHVQQGGTVAVGAMTIPMYENDVGKVIQIATPNGGSTVAEWLAEDIIDCTLLDMDELWYEMAKLVAALAMEIILYKLAAIFGKIFLVFGWLRAVSYYVTRIMHKIFVMLVVCATNAGVFRFFVADLIPDHSTVVPAFGSNHNPDVKYAIIYGIPFTTWNNNIKLFDIIVSEEDALNAGYEGVAVSRTNYDTHMTMTNDAVVMREVSMMLSAPAGAALPIADEPKAWGQDPLTVEDRVLFYWEYLHEFARLWTVSKFKPSLFGLALRSLVNKYTTPGLTTSIAAAEGEDGGALMRTGNSREALQRLAAMKGYAPSAVQSLGMKPRDPSDVQAALDADLARGDVVLDLARVAPDVAVLEVGDVNGAVQWFDVAGEPVARRTLPLLPREIAPYTVLAIPPGGLDAIGQDAATQRLLDAHLRDGGVVLAMNQLAGEDWRALPGGLAGYGSRETALVKEGRVAMSTFTTSLAGQWDPRPAMSIDGHFTKAPANATVLLREEATGNPVFVEYPWHEGRIAALTVNPFSSEGNRLVTDAERILLRDWTNALRVPDPVADFAPNATATLDLLVENLADVPVHAVSVTLIDPFLIVENRTTVALAQPLAPGESATIAHTFVTPTHRGVWTLDARLRDESGEAVFHHYAVARYSVSDFTENPGGFGYRAQPWALVATGEADAVLRGETATATLRVTNRDTADANATLEWWLPGLHARTGDAVYGGGPDGAGFALSQSLDVPAGETVSVDVVVPNVTADDVLTARLVGSGGDVVAQATRPLRAYDPTARISVVPDAPIRSSGESLTVTVDLVDTSADAAARAATVRVVVEDPLGLPILTQDVQTTLGSTPRTFNVTFDLPELASGRHRIDASAVVDGLARGRGMGGFDVPPRQVRVAPALPAAFEAGVAAEVGLALHNAGTLDVSAGSARLSLVDPTGAEGWSQTLAFALAPGASTTLAFTATPASAAPGAHRLVAVVTTEDGTREHAWTLASGVAVRLLPTDTLRARAMTDLPFRVENTGRFVVDGAFEATAPTLGLHATLPLRLLPGSQTDLRVPLAVPADVAPGSHELRAGLPGATTARTLLVPGARVLVETPVVFGELLPGDALVGRARNTGGVDVEVAVTARLADETGRVVAEATAPLSTLAPTESREVPLTIPLDAAHGAYRLSLTATPTDLEGAGTARGSYDVRGLRATLQLASGAPTYDVGTAGTALADVNVTDGALDAASLVLRVLDPTPLPAVERVAAGEDVTAVAAGDSLYAVLRGSRLARLDEGRLVPVTFPETLTPTTFTALAARGAVVAVATDLGILRWNGEAWSALPGAPVSATQLSIDAEGRVWAGAATGLHRHDGAGWTSVATAPGAAVTALDAGETDVWAGLADLHPRFLAPSTLAPPRGALSYETELLTDAQGRLHAFFADGPANETQIWHLLLDARGRPLSGATAVSETPTRLTGGIAVGALPDGRIAVAWHDDRSGGLDVHYRLLDANGRPAAPEVRVTGGPATERYPAITVGADGNVHLFWSDERHPHPRANTNLYRDELYHRKLSPEGAFLTDERRLTDSDAFVWQSRAVTTPEGLVHVVYTSVEIRWRFLFFPYAVFEVHHQMLGDDGSVSQGARLVSRDENGFSWFPDLALDASGAVDVVWQDDREGATALYHRRLHAQTGAPLGAEAKLSPEADGSHRPRFVETPTELRLVWGRPGGFSSAPVASGGFGPLLDLDESGGALPRPAPMADGGFGLLWVNRNATTGEGLRFTRTVADPVGRGLAAVDASSLALALHGGGSLVTSVVATPAGAYAATSDGLLTVDTASGAEAFTRGADATRVARASEGLLAWAGNGSVGRFDDGLPRALGTLAGFPTGGAAYDGDAWFGTSAGLVRVRSDTRNVLSESAVVVVVGPGTTSVSFDVPDGMGRRILEGTLLNGAGQVLDRATATHHALSGDLALTVTPAVERAPRDGVVPLTLVAANRGSFPLRTLNLSVVADGATLVARTVDLMPGDSVSIVTQAAMKGAPGMRLEARAKQPLAGGADARVMDFVQLEGTVRARVVGPAAATDAPFALQLVLENDDDRARSVRVAYECHAERVVQLAPGGSRVLAYEGVAQTRDTTHVFTVTGDASAQATLTVRQSAPPTVRLDGLDVLRPGRGEVALVIENPGLLPVRGTFGMTLRGATLATREADIAPGGSLRETLTLDVAPGPNALAVTGPRLAASLVVLGSETPVLVVSPDTRAPLRPGDALVVTVAHRGPDALAATVEWDLGFALLREDVALAPGAATTLRLVPDLVDVEPGAYPTRIRVVENGVTVSDTAADVAIAQPRLSLVARSTSAALHAGEPAVAEFLVENLGVAPATARLHGAIEGYGEATQTVRLAPGEARDVRLAVPTPPDALPANATLVVTAGDERATIPVEIRMHAATLTAATNATLVPYLEPVLVTAHVAQPGAARELEVRIRHGVYEEVHAVPGLAQFTLESEILVMGERPIEVTLQHPAGRVYEVRSIPLAIQDNATGFRGTLDRLEARAGETLNLTVTTEAAGDVLVEWPGSRLNFTLDGTTTVPIPLPADLPSGEYPVTVSYDFNASTQRVRVRGIEAAAASPRVTLPEAPGGPLAGEVRIRAPVAVQGVLVATLTGRENVIHAQVAVPAVVGPGETTVPFALAVPERASGPAVVVVTYSYAGSQGPVTLLRTESRLELPGTWVEEVEWRAVPGAVEARGVLVTTTGGADLRLSTFLGEAASTVEGAGRHAFAMTIPVPENGNYPLELVVVDADGRELALREAAYHDAPGVAPRTTLRIEGGQTYLPNGTLVVAPDALFALDVVEEGSGLERLSARIDDDGFDYDGPFRLPPGAHEVRYRASDRALNSEPWTLLKVIVDGQAPDMRIAAPSAGALVLDGHEVLPILEFDPVLGSYAVGIAVDGERHVVQGEGADTDGDGAPDAAEILLGTDPLDPESAPSVPATPLPAAPLPAEPALPDADGDGASDAHESAWGTDASSARSSPWTPRPRAPPAFERPMIVVSGDVAVRFNATDAVFPNATLRVLLDGAERLYASDDIDSALSLSGEAAGEHVLTLVAEDGVGNAVRRDFVLLVVPLAPDGLVATLAQEPRAPRWPAQFLNHVEEDASRVADEAVVEGDAQVLRATLVAIAGVDTAMFFVPPAVTKAPAHLEEQVDNLLRDIEECPCTSPPGPEPDPAQWLT